MKLTRTFPLLAVAGALGLAACGGSGGSSGGAATAASGSSGAGGHTVSVKSIDGSRVLVDARGQALYSPVQESDGRIMCTGSCTSIWVPVPAKGTPTAGPGAGKVGVVHRSGGAQVTVNGRPAYTFVQDQPGQVTGQNVKDAFGGHHFTWHVLTAAGASTPAPPSSSGGGSTGGGSTGGVYGY